MSTSIFVEQFEKFFSVIISYNHAGMTFSLKQDLATFEKKLIQFMKKYSYEKQDSKWFPAKPGTFGPDDTGYEYFIQNEELDITIDPSTNTINIL